MRGEGGTATAELQVGRRTVDVGRDCEKQLRRAGGLRKATADWTWGDERIPLGWLFLAAMKEEHAGGGG